MWLVGHTHTHPDDDHGAKPHIENVWGTPFLNVASLSRHRLPLMTPPISRLLTFTPGIDEVCVQCYLHTDQHAAQGWYPPAERTITLPRTAIGSTSPAKSTIPAPQNIWVDSFDRLCRRAK